MCSLAAAAAAWGGLRLAARLEAVLAPRLIGTWPVVVAALAVGALGLCVFLGISSIRAAGWLRGLGFGALVAAVVWLPTALAAAVLPHGAGPVTAVYRSLGDPPAGRWAALALGVVLMLLLAGPLAGSALRVARGWMRADAPEFRRRLVRVVAGWPAVTVSVLLLTFGGWGRSPLAALWALVVLAALHLRTG
jgi:hypothetical protein